MSQIVDPRLADDCIANYEQIYQSGNATAIANTYTSQIAFTLSSVKALVNAGVDTDYLQMKLGVYTPAFAAAYPGTIAGRLTVFIYKVDSNNPILVLGDPGNPPPLNVGTIEP